MTEPTQSCDLCGRTVTVVQTGNGFPPRLAELRLRRQCQAAGCPCEPRYRAGVDLGGLR